MARTIHAERSIAAHAHSSQRFSARRFAESRTRRSFFIFTIQSDKVLTCVDCKQQFTFTESEQRFYADRQFSEPRRCPSCRAARKAARGTDRDSWGSSAGRWQGGGYERAPREMFSATCSACGREAQVPFRPNGSKPVYCSDCFTSQRRSY